MKLEFIGVGEAFDPALGNSSVLIHAENERLLIDCGFGVPARLFPRNDPPDSLSAIYITHFHADHYFGLPAVFVRAAEDGRKAPLTIIGQAPLQETVHRLLDMAYPGSRAKLTYELRFVETTDRCQFGSLTLHCAETKHAVRNFAVRIESRETSVAVSGDGEITAASRKLFRPCTALVHECYRAVEHQTNHASAAEVISMADDLPNLRTLFLSHLQREERRTQLPRFVHAGDNRPYRMIVPEPGDIAEV